jgi:hypothetical protein
MVVPLSIINSAAFLFTMKQDKGKMGTLTLCPEERVPREKK